MDAAAELGGAARLAAREGMAQTVAGSAQLGAAVAAGNIAEGVGEQTPN
jgi:hypothetical protein